MGTAYKAYLLPRQRAFRPDAARLLRLVQRLRQDRWLPAAAEVREETDEETFWTASSVDGQETVLPSPLTQEWLEQVLESDSVLSWTIVDYDRVDLLYPFTKRPAELPYCDLVLHLPVDYVFDSDRTSFDREGTGSWLSRLLRRPGWEKTVLCSCGEDLAYRAPEWSYGAEGRLRTVCPRCGAPFDPTLLPATIRDPYGKQERLPGGLTYRFALLLDCEKSLPSLDEDFKVEPPLLSLVESVLDQEIVVVSELY